MEGIGKGGPATIGVCGVGAGPWGASGAMWARSSVERVAIVGVTGGGPRSGVMGGGARWTGEGVSGTMIGATADVDGTTGVGVKQASTATP